jgi:hypothetical protein
MSELGRWDDTDMMANRYVVYGTKPEEESMV